MEVANWTLDWQLSDSSLVPCCLLWAALNQAAPFWWLVTVIMTVQLLWTLHRHPEETPLGCKDHCEHGTCLSHNFCFKEALLQSWLLQIIYTGSAILHLNHGKPLWLLDALTRSCSGWIHPSCRYSHSGQRSTPPVIQQNVFGGTGNGAQACYVSSLLWSVWETSLLCITPLSWQH